MIGDFVFFNGGRKCVGEIGFLRERGGGGMAGRGGGGVVESPDKPERDSSAGVLKNIKPRDVFTQSDFHRKQAIE